MRDTQGLVGVLLHKKDRGAVGVHLVDDGEDLLDDDGRKPERRLIQKEKGGPGHEGAADGEHLLLAAGERAPRLAAAFGQDGKKLEHIVHVLAHALDVPAQKGAEVQIFLDAHIGKDETPLGHLGNAEHDDFMRRKFVDGPAVPEDLPAPGAQDAADGHQRGGFARAVGADERDDLAVVHMERDVPQGLDIAVIGIHTAQFKHRFLPDTP